MQFGKSTTPVVRLITFQSVENVSGQKPWRMICSTMSQRMWSRTPLPTSNTMPRRRAASTSGRMRPSSPRIAFGGGANRCVTMSPGSQQRQQLRAATTALWPMWIITGRSTARSVAACASSTSTSFAPVDGLRQPRLHADDVVAMPLDCGARGADVGECEILGVAVGQDAGAADVDQHAARLRRRPRDRDDGVDAVGARRARVDPARDAVAQQHAGTFQVAARMRVDVDQARHDELAAGVERRGALGRERGLDGRDSARRDADVAHGVEPQRRVDDAPAFDDEVEPCAAAPPAGRCRARSAALAAACTNSRLFMAVPPGAAVRASLASLRARVTASRSEKHAAAPARPRRLTWRHPSTNGR